MSSSHFLLDAAGASFTGGHTGVPVWNSPA